MPGNIEAWPGFVPARCQWMLQEASRAQTFVQTTISPSINVNPTVNMGGNAVNMGGNTISPNMVVGSDAGGAAGSGQPMPQAGQAFVVPPGYKLVPEGHSSTFPSVSGAPICKPGCFCSASWTNHVGLECWRMPSSLYLTCTCTPQDAAEFLWRLPHYHLPEASPRAASLYSRSKLLAGG